MFLGFGRRRSSGHYRKEMPLRTQWQITSPNIGLSVSRANANNEKQTNSTAKSPFQGLLVVKGSITESPKQHKTHTSVSPLRNQTDF